MGNGLKLATDGRSEFKDQSLKILENLGVNGHVRVEAVIRSVSSNGSFTIRSSKKAKRKTTRCQLSEKTLIVFNEYPNIIAMKSGDRVEFKGSIFRQTFRRGGVVVRQMNLGAYNATSVKIVGKSRPIARTKK